MKKLSISKFNFTAKADSKLISLVIDLIFDLEDLDSRKFDKLLLKHGVSYLDELEDWTTQDLLSLKKELQKLIG